MLLLEAKVSVAKQASVGSSSTSKLKVYSLNCKLKMNNLPNGQLPNGGLPEGQLLQNGVILPNGQFVPNGQFQLDGPLNVEHPQNGHIGLNQQQQQPPPPPPPEGPPSPGPDWGFLNDENLEMLPNDDEVNEFFGQHGLGDDDLQDLQYLAQQLYHLQEFVHPPPPADPPAEN